MRFGSVCSGIEAASVAWGPLGWKAAWLSEIEPFPCAVLKHHYPDVPNYGDMTTLPRRILSGAVEAPELFCGGTPCQAFSVAGLRKSLGDARGNLSLTFCEIADAIDIVRFHQGKQPCLVFWENVPGVLSTSDNAFGCFLAQLCGGNQPLLAPHGWPNAGCVSGPRRTAAWRVLDAQYFGVAQRRRRVFVVASARNGFDPAAVLFEFDGVRRDTAPSREAGQVAPTIPARSTAGGGLGTDFDCDGGVQPVASSWWDGGQVAATITTRSFAQDMPDKGNFQGLVQPVAHTLRGEGFNASEDGTGRGTPLVPVGVTLHGTHGTTSVASLTSVSSSLRARIPSGVENSTTTAVLQPIAYSMVTANTKANGLGVSVEIAPTLDRAQPAAVAQPIAFHPTQEPISSNDICHSIGANNNATAVAFDAYNQSVSDVSHPLRVGFGNGLGDEIPQTIHNMQVRRLTPVECERLQGFPDGYTNIPWRSKPESPDGPRYKALGNSWAVPVVRWIGERIEATIREKNT